MLIFINTDFPVLDIDFVIGLPLEKYYRKAFNYAPSLLMDWESFTASYGWKIMYKFMFDSHTREHLIPSFTNPVEFSKVCTNKIPPVPKRWQFHWGSYGCKEGTRKKKKNKKKYLHFGNHGVLCK